MVLVNKEESEAIRRRFPDMPQTRTCRQKSKLHRYYVPETDGILKLLRDLRNVGVSRFSHNTEQKGGHAIV